MRTLLVMLMLVSFVFTQAACSVGAAISQPPPANLTGIGIGTPRQQLINQLGIPKLSETNPQGQKEDSFEFHSGMNPASKARVILYIAADLFTLCLAEIILWPMELTLMKDATCEAFATYDSSLKVETWRLTQKSGVQGC